jgi:hypothetical protein
MEVVWSEISTWIAGDGGIPVCDNDIGMGGGGLFEELVVGFWVAVGVGW